MLFPTVMPSYYVEFTTPSGAPGEAALNAPSLPALARRLEAQGCTLARVSPPRPDPALGAYWRSVSEAERVTILRQLASILENGVAAAAALALLAREARNPTLKGVLLHMERAARAGDTLSCAFAAYPRLFSPLYVRMLEAGEAGQRLPETLRLLAEYAEQVSRAGQRIRTALIYPQVVGVFTLAVLLLTFVYVTPGYLELFRELGVKELPFFTVTLYWFRGMVLPAVLFLLPAALLLFGALYRTVERRAPHRAAELRTRIPVVGALYHHLGLVRLTRLLAALLAGGIPLLEALRLAGQGAEHPLLQAAMWDAIPHVAAGESLAAAFGHAGILPPTFCGQVAAAETSGDLPAALARLADWYAERLDYLAARAGALIEPFFIVALALLAAWVALGVFTPLVTLVETLSMLSGVP